jgi:hypothetical protein
MRKAIVAAALALAVATAAGRAQGISNFMGRATPATQIVNVPIDTSRAVGPLPQPHTFSFSSLFTGLHLPHFPSFIGQSPFPSPDSFPSTHYPNKLQPVMPIVPGQ